MASLSRASKYRRLAAVFRSIDKQFSDSSGDNSDLNESTFNLNADLIDKGSDHNDGHNVNVNDCDLSSVYSWSCSSCNSNSASDKNDSEDFEELVEYFGCNGTSNTVPECRREESDIKYVLRQWFMEDNVSLVSLGGLLLKLQPFFDGLPRDPRTIVGKLNTPSIQPMGVGQYVNFGLKNQLHNALCNYPFSESAVFLTFHVDGLPLFKSSGIQLWPILFSMFHAADMPPSVVCMYAGQGKAKLTDFLKDFVPDLKDLLQNGIQVKGKHYSVKIRCFVCDAPARAYIKGTQGHTGFCACEHCIQVGYKDQGRTVFSRMNAPRTDEAFVAKTQRNHHNEHSPLTDLGIGMVSQFPLDYMHLVLQGVVRTFVIMWVSEKKPYKLGNGDIKKMEQVICIVKKMWPMDFSRRPRALKDSMMWKATEFRQFVLYLCVSLLKCSLMDKCYNHFMLLHCAITILCREDLHATKVDYAEELLRQFFFDLPALYGSHFQYYNFHCLIHLTDCARAYGVLDSFSAFPYENFLHTLKKFCKSNRYPLVSIVNKLTGKVDSGIIPGLSSKKPVHDGPLQTSSHCKGPTSFLKGRQYTKFNWSGFRLSTRPGDNCISFKSKRTGIIKNFVVSSSGTFVIVLLFRKKCDAYVYPCKSSTLGIFKVSDLAARPVPMPMTAIVCKNVLIPFHGKDYQFVAPIRL